MRQRRRVAACPGVELLDAGAHVHDDGLVAS